jgi:hypothetical protein
MSDSIDNPMGLQGFEFVEFASPTPNLLEPLFEKIGFSGQTRDPAPDVAQCLVSVPGGFVVDRNKVIGESARWSTRAARPRHRSSSPLRSSGRPSLVSCETTVADYQRADRD